MLLHTDADAAGKTQKPGLALPKRRKRRMLSYRLSHHRLCRHQCQLRSCQTRMCLWSWRRRLGCQCWAEMRRRLEFGMRRRVGWPREQPQGAAAETLASTHEGTLLLRALASPAAETMIRIPGKAEWRQCCVLHCDGWLIRSSHMSRNQRLRGGLKQRRLIDGCGCYPPFCCGSLRRLRRLMRMRRLPVPEKENQTHRGGPCP